MTTSPPPSDPAGDGDHLVVAEHIQTALSGHVEPHGLLVVDVDALSGRHVALVGGEQQNFTSWLCCMKSQRDTKATGLTLPPQVKRSAWRLRHLFDLSRQHAALQTQHGGDVDVLSAHVIHPLGEAVHCGLGQHPGELDDVEHSFDDVV